MHQTIMENPVTTILSKIDASNLPVVPQVLLDLINATHQTEVNFRDLAKIISHDASLSSKLLAAANSSFYRHWGEVTDLNRVVVVLGLNTVKTLAITRTVQQFFSQIPLIHYDFLEIIWYRSLTCAHLARNLANLTSYDFPDEAYLTGLIHRLGQIVFLKCFPKEYPDFLIQNFDGQQESIERKMFGATHYEVGGYLIETWNIQSFISDAVLYQSQSFEEIADSAKLVKIVNLANQLSIIDPVKKINIFDLADKLFGLNHSLLEEMLGEAETQVEQSAQHLGIKIVHPQGSKIKCMTSDAQRNEIQNNFAEHIKDLALTSAVKQQLEPSSEINKLVTIIQRDISVLFGFQVTAIFLFRHETNSLIGVLGEQDTDSLWPTISISAKPDKSLLAKALSKKMILHSFDSEKSEPASIVDRQIRRLLGSEGMLVIPLWSNDCVVGVIVSALKQSEVDTVGLKINFLSLFARESALALLKAKKPSDPSDKTIESVRESYHLHAQKLAHEANNPLSIINNYLHLLGQKLGEDNSNEIRIIQEEIDRVGKIVLRLPDAMENTDLENNALVNINALIIDLIDLFQSSIFKTHDIEVGLNLDYALPEISSSKGKLKQILTNLIKNSTEAMTSGGRISISTKVLNKSSEKLFVEIQVHDDGPGLPPAITKNLFTPVTSTKGKDHSGLGLTICKNLVDELGGTIQCDSSPEKGTTFRISLPNDKQ